MFQAESRHCVYTTVLCLQCLAKIKMKRALGRVTFPVDVDRKSEWRKVSILSYQAEKVIKLLKMEL